MFGSRKHQRREAAKAAPFPETWRHVLRQWFPLFDRLAAADQRELEGHIQVFLAEKTFEGCGGLEITDEIRVTIAAHACILLLHRDTDYYPFVRSILVFPGSHFESASSFGEENEEYTRQCAGEAWPDAVIFAWDVVVGGAFNITDGYNVAFHEFAHQLDLEDGQADGAPVLDAGENFRTRWNRYATWARIMAAEYAELRRKDEAEEESVIDKYGAANPAEFFAVVTECFFEKPQALRKKHPELYAELQKYFRQDPVQWLPEC